MDCSAQGLSVHWISQSRRWISFSRGSSWPRDWTCVSCIGRQILYHRATRKPLTPHVVLWGCWIVWCILTSRYLVSLLPVSIIHVSDIFLVGFWSWEISFIMWGCRGWGWQAAGTWVSVSVKWWDSPPSLGDLEPANQYAPSKSPRKSWKARGRLSLKKSPRRLYQ